MMGVKSEGINGGNVDFNNKEKSRFVVSLGFGEEELDWLLEHLKKVVELEASREIVAKRKPLVLVVPEGVKGNGWETLRKAISRVQDVSDQARKGHRSGTLVPVGKWARAVICESKGKILDWFDVGKVIARMMGYGKEWCLKFNSERRGCSLRRWSPKENSIVGGKFRRGWLELRGLPFHLWDEFQLRYILQKWGRVTKVAKETLKLVDLSKVKLWVEMHPNVVLPALLEVEDRAWSFTVAVSVTEEAEKTIFSGQSQIAARTKGKSRLGPKAGSVVGPTKPDAFFKGRFARAHFEEKNIGPIVGPVHETEAGSSNGGPATPSSSKLQRSGTSAKEVMPIAHSQESAKLKGNSVTARRKARSWASLKVTSCPKRNLDGDGAPEANRGFIWGRSVFKKGALSPVSEKSRHFTGGTEGDEGISLATGKKAQRSFVSQGRLVPKPRTSHLPLEGFQVEGLTPGKMVKVQSVLESLRIRIVRENGKGAEEENQNFKLEYERIRIQEEKEDFRRFLSTQNPDIVMLQETKRETWDEVCEQCLERQRVEWAALPACGASGGIVILWDSNKFECTEKVLGSFSVTVKFNSGEEGGYLRNWETRLTFNMRCFDEFIRESGLLDPPLRNAAFTWSNMQADP
ncbi:hypothetical protein CK203_062400, partial [Vitis vinifera]